MVKKVKNKAKIVLSVFVLYWAVCLAVAIIASIVSAYAVLNSHFTLSKLSSVTARGSLFPYIQLSKKTDYTFFLVWERGLLLLEKAPSLAHNIRALQKSYVDRTPLDPKLILDIQTEYSSLLHEWATFEQLAYQSPLATELLSQTPYKKIQFQFAQNTQLFQATDTFLNFLTKKLWEGKPVDLLILFQNNMELRATGGFPGSYAILHLANNEPIEFEVQDIYVPDGQLQGHVDPPLPIQEAFQQGFWKLRDSNWHPDFQESTKSVKWFFSEAGYPDYDGVIGLNFTLVQKLLAITGPIKVADLNTTITPDNVYRILQRTDDKEFFAGSTKKKDTLSAFSTQLLLTLQHLPTKKYIDISELINQQLKEKNIFLSMSDPDLSTLARLNHWDGKLTPVTCDREGCSQDYFSIFEANLGVNKSNCCVKRAITLTKESAGQKLLTTTTTLHYQNSGPGTEYVGVAGHYKAFIRLYYPANTQLIPPVIDGQSYTEYVRDMKSKGFFHPITSEGYSWGEVYGMKELGLWIEIEPEKELNITIETQNEMNPDLPYSLILQKQSGTLDQFSIFNITWNAKNLFSGILSTDLVLK